MGSIPTAGTIPMNSEPILGFFGPFRWLSNFHYANVELDGVLYTTNEHAYQAAKHLDLDYRAFIGRLTKPRDAMVAGRDRPARQGWDEMKYDVMWDLNAQKFSNHPKLREMLLETGDAYLEETNSWGDIYWGVCNGVGQNNLGKILMDVRSKISSITA